VNRDEWNAVLATESATANQLGAIMGEFARLGISDRAERLAVCAALLDLDELDTSADLTMGDAGRLLNVLQHTADRAELPDVTALDGDGSDDERTGAGTRAGSKPVTIADLIGQLALLLAQVFSPVPEHAKPDIAEGTIPDDRD
jgi:hypothetical protein